MRPNERDARRAVFWVRQLMPGNYQKLVDEGAVDNESFRIQGDDLADLCTRVKQLMEYFEIPDEFLEGYNYVYEVENESNNLPAG